MFSFLSYCNIQTPTSSHTFTWFKFCTDAPISFLSLDTVLPGLYPHLRFSLGTAFSHLNRSSTIPAATCHQHFLSSLEFSLLTKLLLTFPYPLLCPHFLPPFYSSCTIFTYIYGRYRGYASFPQSSPLISQFKVFPAPA